MGYPGGSEHHTFKVDAFAEDIVIVAPPLARRNIYLIVSIRVVD